MKGQERELVENKGRVGLGGFADSVERPQDGGSGITELWLFFGEKQLPAWGRGRLSPTAVKANRVSFDGANLLDTRLSLVPTHGFFTWWVATRKHLLNTDSSRKRRRHTTEVYRGLKVSSITAPKYGVGP